MLRIVRNDFSESPWMECMLRIVRNDFSESPWMECMLRIVRNDSGEFPWTEWQKIAEEQFQRIFHFSFFIIH